MPRPKVRPEDRQRSSKACSTCKASKIRCNSELPCLSCVKRGREATCEYSNIDGRRRHGPRALHNRRAASALSPGIAETSRTWPAAQESSMTPATSLSLRTPPATDSCTENASQVGPQVPASLVLSDNEDGEQAYLGESDSPSFLYFLRNTIRPFVGSTRFTDVTNSQHPSVQPTRPRADIDLSLSVEDTYCLLDFYFEATSGLLDLFTADEIDSLVEARTNPSADSSLPEIHRENSAALDVALAIGAQTQPPQRRIISPEAASSFFSRARQAAFEDMLDRPSYTMIRLFLLMAFYMLGDCRRNTACMYLGVACKAADILARRGPQGNRESRLDDESLRFRINDSLTVVNVLASFIVGRRQSIPLVDVELAKPGLPRRGARVSRDQSTYMAMFDGCIHIERIVQSLRTGSMLHVPAAESLLENLREWSQSLADPVRQFTFSQSAELTSTDRVSLVGHMHLSCMYYFSVILVTRPFLIAYLLSRLRGRAPDHLIKDPEEAADVTIKNNKVSKMAQVCVSAATCMIETIQKVKGSRFEFGNLCILKAWVFGSGLVLGFSMFAGEPRMDIQDAFEGAREILECIAEVSPQARVHHDILTDLDESVGRYRQRVGMEIRKTVQHYLDPVPFLQVAEDEDQTTLSPFSLGANTVVPLPSGGAQGFGAPDGGEVDMAMDLGLQINWADFDLHLIDKNLASTHEPFEGLICSVE